jgi:hypothetical protein
VIRQTRITACNPAEGEGFEPSGRLHAQRFSRPPRSTAPAPLLAEKEGFEPSRQGFPHLTP